MKLINGKKLAEGIKDKVVKEIIALDGGRPNLAIILIGEREDSNLYVSLKEKEAVKVGIDTHTYRMDSSISEKEVLIAIDCLNADNLVDGILVQLPLPKKFNTDKIIDRIDFTKDVDRFHQKNLNDKEIISPVYSSVLEVLASIKYELKDKAVGIVYNSPIFGESLAKILSSKGAKVDLIQSEDKELGKKISQVDVLITAVGKPLFIKKDMIKEGVAIIDIGITKVGDKVLGDVDSVDIKDKASYLTPVPGGIGPMTIAGLFKNTLAIYKKRNH